MDKEDVNQPPEPSQVSCPYCKDYVGVPNSVRGHIRAKTDDQHKGKSGFEEGTDQAMQEAEQSPEPEPVFDKPVAEASAEQATDTDTGQQSQGIGGLVVAGLVIVLLWVARQTDNEDELQNRIGPGGPR